MKAIKTITTLFILLMGIIIIGINIYLYNLSFTVGRPHQVEGNRIALDIEKNSLTNLDLSNYRYILNVEEYGNDDFYTVDVDYFIKNINDKLYRFDYITDTSSYNIKQIVAINSVLGITTILILFVLIYIKTRILKPFNILSDVPYQISRGNLTVPLKEYKGKLFGRFVWGINMLRENIEEHKTNELALQKEKKTFVLSISHDIKTPLSAIKLYSQALSTNLYKDEEKQHEIAQRINAKADEIEDFVTQIIKASSEDFLKLEVTNGEFYFSELINNIKIFYKEKLKLLNIDFSVDKFYDCLLIGDIDRAIEVLQNIVENAIKYGDGHNIGLSFSNEENCQLITVTNSGCTLSESDISHVFDSFWRGSNVDSHDGSGLGLYICRQLMYKMNGDIFVQTDKENMLVTTVFRLA